MKIHEVIYFTHELDMLECHLEEHQHFVDKFWVKESPVLWSGPEKPLLLTENLDRFKRFNLEVMIIPASEFQEIPETFPEEDFKKWYNVRRENRVKSRDYKWGQICQGSDYVLSMDCDEIIDQKRSHLLLDAMLGRNFEHICVTLQQHQFWVNSPGRKIKIYRGFRSDVPHRHEVKGRPRTVTPNIGWHFTNCYWPEGIMLKFKGMSTHYGLHGAADVPTSNAIKASLKKGLNPLLVHTGKKGDERAACPPKRAIPNMDWAPKFMRENPSRFPRWEE